MAAPFSYAGDSNEQNRIKISNLLCDSDPELQKQENSTSSSNDVDIIILDEDSCDSDQESQKPESPSKKAKISALCNSSDIKYVRNVSMRGEKVLKPHVKTSTSCQLTNREQRPQSNSIISTTGPIIVLDNEENVENAQQVSNQSNTRVSVSSLVCQEAPAILGRSIFSESEKKPHTVSIAAWHKKFVEEQKPAFIVVSDELLSCHIQEIPNSYTKYRLTCLLEKCISSIINFTTKGNASIHYLSHLVRSHMPKRIRDKVIALNGLDPKIANDSLARHYILSSSLFESVTYNGVHKMPLRDNYYDSLGLSGFTVVVRKP